MNECTACGNGFAGIHLLEVSRILLTNCISQLNESDAGLFIETSQEISVDCGSYSRNLGSGILVVGTMVRTSFQISIEHVKASVNNERGIWLTTDFVRTVTIDYCETNLNGLEGVFIDVDIRTASLGVIFSFVTINSQEIRLANNISLSNSSYGYLMRTTDTVIGLNITDMFAPIGLINTVKGIMNPDFTPLSSLIGTIPAVQSGPTAQTGLTGAFNLFPPPIIAIWGPIFSNGLHANSVNGNYTDRTVMFDIEGVTPA